MKTHWVSSVTGLVLVVRWICWKTASGSGGGDPNSISGTESLNTLRDRITQINGIDEVRMDDSWFARLAALTGLVGRFGDDRRVDGGGPCSSSSVTVCV